MDAAITVSGAKELRKALRQADPKGAPMKAIHAEIAADVEGAARPLVPVRSGRLLKSLRSSGTISKAIVRLGRSTVRYAGPVHFGWPTRPNPARGWRGGPIRPNPFLYAAIDRRHDEVIGAYHAGLAAAVAKAGLHVRSY